MKVKRVRMGKAGMRCRASTGKKKGKLVKCPSNLRGGTDGTGGMGGRKKGRKCKRMGRGPTGARRCMKY